MIVLELILIQVSLTIDEEPLRNFFIGFSIRSRDRTRFFVTSHTFLSLRVRKSSMFIVLTVSVLDVKWDLTSSKKRNVFRSFSKRRFLNQDSPKFVGNRTKKMSTVLTFAPKLQVSFEAMVTKGTKRIVRINTEKQIFISHIIMF